jgi:hypothetical protein
VAINVFSGAAATFGAVAVGGTLFRATTDAGGMMGGIGIEEMATGSVAGRRTSGGFSLLGTA